jgi:hypothetical protein
MLLSITSCYSGEFLMPEMLLSITSCYSEEFPPPEMLLSITSCYSEEFPPPEMLLSITSCRFVIQRGVPTARDVAKASLAVYPSYSGE